MTVGTVLSVIALVTSVVTFFISRRAADRAEQRGRMPVLAFVYDESRGWILRNVGRGPALNIIVAQKRPGDGWFAPVRVPPLANDGEMLCPWLGHVNDTGLGATYTDLLGSDDGAWYTMTCADDLVQVREGRQLPAWPESAVGRHWHPQAPAPEEG
jgi:hypothetical protein